MKIETNKIYLGDSYELIKDVQDKSIDLIVTDPPYNIGHGGHFGGLFKDRKKNYMLDMEKLDIVDGFNLDIFNEYVRVLKKINIYMV